MKYWPVFPRSLRQLVILVSLLTLLPLLVLTWQAWQSLSTLSDQAALVNHITLTDARRSEVMTSAVLETECSYYQYCILDGPTPAKAYQSQHERYSEMLDAHVGVLPDDKLYQALRQGLYNLAQLQCNNSSPNAVAAARLGAFVSTNTEMVQATRIVVLPHGQRLQREIVEHGQYFGWQSLVLFPVGLVMVLSFTRIITRSAKNIECMVGRLGGERSLGNGVSFSGPSELRPIGQHALWLSERLSWLGSQRHQFLRHLPHELGMSLASMREGTELLADQVVGPFMPEQEEVVNIPDSNNRNLQKLIGQSLDYNHKQADSAVGLENIKLVLLMEAVVSTHSLSARARMMHTDADLKAAVCPAEPMLLMSVSDNPYSNAVHYGAESGSICLRNSLHGAWVYIGVISTGTSIPQEECTMVFEPFFQGSHQRKEAVEGSGLGLDVTRDRICRIQGGLYLVNESGQGVCFRIELPSSKNTK